MGILFSTVRENELLNEKVMRDLPSHCECGRELEFSESLRRLYCGDPDCRKKVMARFPEGKYVEGMKTPYQLLESEEVQESKYFELWEIVAYAKIPEIKGVEYRLFKGYDSMEEAYKDIERGKVPFIAYKLGIEESSGLPLALHIYRVLLDKKNELFYGEGWFKLKSAAEKVFYVYVEGNVYGHRTKGSYVSFLNKRYRGKASFLLGTKVDQDTDIFVYDGEVDTKEYRKALRINEIADEMDSSRLDPEGYPILICDSGALVTQLDRKLMRS